MSLLQPDFGLVIWMTIAFLIVWVALAKFAWKPILKAIRDRENQITTALSESKNAQEQVAQIKEEMLVSKKQASAERDKILADAEKRAHDIISAAEDKAKEQASKILESAQQEIQQQKDNLAEEIRLQIVNTSVNIASKVMEKKLSQDKEQIDYINSLLNTQAN